jgi:hypothetical protein
MAKPDRRDHEREKLAQRREGEPVAEYFERAFGPEVIPCPVSSPEDQSRENAIESRTVEGLNVVDVPIESLRWAEPVSTAHQQGDTQEQEAHTSNAAQSAVYAAYADGTPETGDVPATAVSGDPAEPVEPHTHTRDLSPLAVTNRLRKEGRWNEVEPIRDQMMRECKKRLPDKELRQAWVYSELDRMYPPVQSKPGDSDTGFVGTKGLREGLSDTYPKLPSSEGSDSGSIQGLSDLPKGWPELPANAALSAEVGWVQANRLFMVEERPGKATLVRLDQAASPAPSRAALGWLETSIRSYAKFVDVAAKVSGGTDDEGAVMRRERKSVDEVKALLREMEESEDTCPHCGRPRP